MNLFQLTVTALNTAAFVYLAACIGFIVGVARAGTKGQNRWNAFASLCVVIGFALHTFGLGGRWVIGGISRPPWTNLYESLVFFAWGVSLFSVVALRKWKLPILGLVSSPLIFLLMGMSVMTSNKSVEPLIPALQSYWLKIHVVFGMLSYAGFTVAACLGFLHLIRSKASLSKIGSGLALVILFNLAIAGGKEVVNTGHFYMAKTTTKQNPDGTIVKTKDTYRDSPSGPVITRMEEVPGATIPFWFSTLLFAAAIVVMPLTRKRELNGENDLSPVGFGVFAGALVSMFGFLGAMGYAVQTHETLTLHSNPYLVFLLMMTVFFALMFVLVKFRYEAFNAGLPSAERLDELSYKNILFAFPFQTLLLITGAVWANYAWGRSWGWDPKETWALLTWFCFLIYLHGKLLANWKPRFLSVLAIIGFVIMVFAFLGVNLVLSGLHSYGSA